MTIRSFLALGLAWGRAPRRLVTIGAAAAVTSLFGGCAAQTQLDQLQAENRSLKERNTELSRSILEKDNELGMIQRQRAGGDATMQELQAANERLRKQLADAGIDLDKINQRLAGMNFQTLDPETDRALRELAGRFPDLISYDSQTGMLRFASDLTFDSGSDVVKEQARTGLAALAKVLTGVGGQYELFIVGHTDSQPISGGTAPRHPTNVHLSAHRAIAVRRALADLGISAQKMLVAGWGEQRPAVPNNPNGNTPANRRVEIFLTKPTIGMSDSKADSRTPDRAPPRREPEPTK